MKKRLLTLVLSLILALSLAGPAMMTEDTSPPEPAESPSPSSAPEPPPPIEPPASFAALSSFIRLQTLGASFIRDYAMVEQSRWTAHSTQIAWKDFGAANVTPDGTVDITNIVNVRNPSYLFVSRNPELKSKKTMGALAASLSSFVQGTDYNIYNILPPAAKPSIPRPVFSDNADGSPVSKYTFTADGLEYQKLGEKDKWKEVPAEWNIELEEYRVEYSVRVKATAEKAASLPVKMTVPALAAPPSVKLDIIKGEIKAKNGWQIKTDITAGVITLNSARTFTAGHSEDNFEKGEIGEGSKLFMFRVPSSADGKRAGTAWTTLHINFERSPALDGDADDYFALTARNVIITGAVPIQINVGGRWKTVKNIKFNEIHDTDGVQVRMAGTRTKLPGDIKTLYLDKTAGTLTFTKG